MILLGIFYGRLKTYICWLAPTCLYLEEADTQQSACASGNQARVPLDQPSVCFRLSIPASLPFLVVFISLLAPPVEMAAVRKECFSKC